MFSITYRIGEVYVTLSADTVEEVLALDDSYNSDDDDGWIIWNGGKCPVDVGTNVNVRFRSGSIIIGDNPDSFYWYHSGSSGDIVAYKVIENA